MHVYIKTSKDEYRHIVAMADTAKELAKICGVKTETIYWSVCVGNTLYEKVDIDEDDEE